MAVKVSVRMLAYNHERFIAQAVESALMQQTNFDYEIVVGEDCSTDRTRQILLELRNHHPDKLRLLLRKRNLGPHLNGTGTWKACRGEYIAWLDGDDYWTSPYKLQKQVDFLDAHPGFSLCGHRYRDVYDDGTRLTDGRVSPVQKEVISLDDFLEGVWIGASTMMIRRSMISQLPDWYDGSFMNGDKALQLLCVEQGHIGFMNEEMTAYRVHQGGAWSALSTAENLNSLVAMFEAFKQHLDEQYHSVLNRKISGKFYALTCLHEEQGDLSQSRACLARARVHNPSPLWLSGHERARLLRRIPRTHALLRTLKRALLALRPG